MVELADRFGEAAAAKVLAGEVVCADGAVVTAATVLPPGAHVYLYRDLPDEVPVPFDIPVLYRDDDIVVVDKPHFLATMPRGGHVAQTATVRLRRELDLPELSPAHRLDRLTAGRAAVHHAAGGAGRVSDAVRARAGAQDVSGAGGGRSGARAADGGAQPNHQAARSVTGGGGAGRAECRDVGRTNSARRAVPADAAHRPHASAARAHGVAGPADHRRLACIPSVVDVARDDFSQPLRLLAHSIEFDDPISGCLRRFVSGRSIEE